MTVPGELQFAEKGKLRCVACGHRCLIGEGQEGVCRVRFVRGRRAPGSLRLRRRARTSIRSRRSRSFTSRPARSRSRSGCSAATTSARYCQNWEISQVHRDPESDAVARARVRRARRARRRSPSPQAPTMVTSTYNEPLITSEWAVAVFRRARAAGLMTSYVSNGNGTPEVLDYLPPLGRRLQGRPEGNARGGLPAGRRAALGRPRDDLAGSSARGFWVEVVTLVVPG